MSKSVILIPSRLSATRLPGKPLLKINGLSIISNKGFLGSLVAESLEGIKITDLDIIFIVNLCVQETQIV